VVSRIVVELPVGRPWCKLRTAVFSWTHAGFTLLPRDRDYTRDATSNRDRDWKSLLRCWSRQSEPSHQPTRLRSAPCRLGNPPDHETGGGTGSNRRHCKGVSFLFSAEVVSYRDEVALHVVRELVSKFDNDSRGGRDSDLTRRGCHNNDFVAVDAPGLEDFPGKSFRDALPFGRLW